MTERSEGKSHAVSERRKGGRSGTLCVEREQSPTEKRSDCNKQGAPTRGGRDGRRGKVGARIEAEAPTEISNVKNECRTSDILHRIKENQGVPLRGQTGRTEGAILADAVAIKCKNRD